MTSTVSSVQEYLDGLSPDRRDAISRVREVVLANLPEGVEEGMQYGMIGYYVPHRVYPKGYHCDPKQPLPFAAIASQKNHMALYLFCVYAGDGAAERFREAYLATGKKLDMGASCVRFKKLEELPLEVIAQTLQEMSVESLIQQVETVLEARKSSKKKR